MRHCVRRYWEPPARPRRSRFGPRLARRAFTLIELLAVVVVLAILAALLLSSFAKAQARAKQTACFSNLRQLGVVTLIYLTEHGCYPGSQDDADNYVWPERLLSVAGANRGIFHCPASSPDSAWDPDSNPSLRGSFRVTSVAKFSYGYNDWGLAMNQDLGLGGIVGAASRSERKESEVVQPSDMIALGDSRPDGNWDANIDPVTLGNNRKGEEWPSSRHDFRCNILFCDGHAESASRRNVVSPQSERWRRRWNYDNRVHSEIKWTITPDLDGVGGRLYW